MKQGPRAFWNSMYDRPDYRYGLEPNAWLVACAASLPAGARVLCVGDGEGRNGVWLAEQGYEVTTIDASDAGVEKARRLAEERGATLDVRRGLFPDDLPGYEGLFDAVALIYVHATPAGRRKVHAAAVAALRAGGIVVLEAFTPAQIGRSSGGPQNVEMLYTADLLREDFAALEIEALEEAAVVRMLARR